MSIEIKDVSKKFGQFAALDDVSLEIPSGELVALLGPVRVGQDDAFAGDCRAGVSRAGSIAVRRRRHYATAPRATAESGFVFQHYALFRHMTVFENIAFGLRVRPRNLRPSKQKSATRCMSC